MNTERLSLWVIVYGCAVALGTCYIFAFWRPFGFNIFPYLSTTDILTSPLNRILVIIVPIVTIIVSQIEQDDKTSLKLPSYTLTSLAIICYMMAARQAYGALERFNTFEFHFRNEKSIIVILGIFIAISTVFLINSIFVKDSKLQKIAVIGILQITTVLGMGYQDGKAIFNGAQNVHLLEEKELCEKNGIRDWVYIEKFGTHTFFMNTIDKRLCILEAKEFKLYSRVIKENL